MELLRSFLLWVGNWLWTVVEWRPKPKPELPPFNETEYGAERFNHYMAMGWPTHQAYLASLIDVESVRRHNEQPRKRR